MNKKDIGLAALSGTLFAFSLPPFKTGFLAYGALVPFFFLIDKKSLKDAARWGYVTGAIIAVLTLNWIAWATFGGFIGVLLVWPLYLTLWSVSFTLLKQRFGDSAFLFAPLLWTTMEYLQSFSELAFPWNYLGYTQTYYLPLIQFAEYFSVYGVSFWVALLNVLIYLLLKSGNDKPRRVLLSLSIVILWALPLGHGLYRMRTMEEQDESLRVALIQANLDPNEKWSENLYENNFSLYERLTASVLDSNPDLIIWPETAVSFYLRSEPHYQARIHRLIDAPRICFLTGALDYRYIDEQNYVYYNSALFIEPNRQGFQHHHKMKLVPFSERVPYKSFFLFRILKNLLWNFGLGDYAVGQEETVFDGPMRTEPSGRRFKTSAAICYESVFPEHVRRYVDKGAQFLIIITNDAWFGKTQGPFQHNQIAVFRAIETRRDIARCANTGVSCFIDRFGRVRKATKIYTQAVVVDQVRLSDEKTFFVRYGNLFANAAAILSAALLTLCLSARAIKR